LRFKRARRKIKRKAGRVEKESNNAARWKNRKGKE
jgi:hypothetical protein